MLKPAPVKAPRKAPQKAPVEAPNEALLVVPGGVPLGIIVAVGGLKGGVGKTTTVTALAAELMARDLRVAVVDVDPQGTATTWVDVARENGAATPTIRRMGAGMGAEGELPAVAAAHDVTLVDCPPRLDEIQREAIALAHMLLVVTGPNAPETWSLSHTIQVIGDARAIRTDLDVVVLLARRREGTILARGAREELEAAGLTVLVAELTDRAAYPQAIGLGLGPSTFAPRTHAAREVRWLASELLRRFAE